MAWRRVWRRSRTDVRRELDEEIRFHVEQRAAELERRGASAAQARVQALQRFGDMADTVSHCMASDLRRERRYRRRELLEDVVQDARMGARQLLRRPGFALLSIITLGSAIGAAAAIYAVADHVLVRPLPYIEPGRVVTLWEVTQEGTRTEVSPGTSSSGRSGRARTVRWGWRSRSAWTSPAPVRHR